MWTNKKSIQNLWKKRHISSYWKGRVIEYFCLGVPAYRLRFQVPYSQPTLQRCLGMFRETIYYDNIKDFKPLSGEIEMVETMTGGRRPGKRGWGATDKTIVFGIYQMRQSAYFSYHIACQGEDASLYYQIEQSRESLLYR